MESGGTLQEWSGRRTVMDAYPAMDCYEDMFKEITRKLYGEDGLPDMAEGDHGSSLRNSSDYDGETPDNNHGALAAFGLAALMQNGFPPPPGMFGHHHHIQAETIKYRPSGEDKWVSSEEVLQWTSSKIATYNAAQKLFRCTECECVGFLSRVAEHWLGTHANLRVFQCPQCPYASAWARCVRMHLQRQHNIFDSPDNSTELWKENPVLEEVTKYLQRLKTKVETSFKQCVTSPSSHSSLKQEYSSSGQQNHGLTRNSGSSKTNSQAPGSENTPNKRYCCTFCPYATDRRDLFTRHENIHRDEKPFQCYVCQKQFNRADHVKKHFLRMHRDHPYDLNRIRKQPPKNSNGISYYQKYSSSQQNTPRSQITQGQMGPHGLNIPAGFPPPPIRGVKPPLSSPPKLQQNGCNGKSKNSKKKGEKRYSCCYCTWSGVDNWCLKRHLNTHLKPFVCGLCDYKAARSERLATHVLKVHNKRACGRCSFLGEDSAQLTMHMQEHHPLEHRNRSSNTLRNANFTNNHGSSALSSSSFCSHDSISSNSNPTSRRNYEESSTSGLWNPHGHVPGSYPLQDDSWKSSNKHFGAARLFHYMEASDNSEPENDHEDEEPPPFICRECGCEFVDDTSLETHVFMHHRSTGQRNAKQDSIRGVTDANINLSDCSTQREESPLSKRPRKQQRPKKIVPTTEIRVLRRSQRLRRRNPPVDYVSRLRKKYVARLVTRKSLRCFWCKSWSKVHPYHTLSTLILHKMWRHRRDKFGCKHCQVRFRHRCQVVLHSRKAHLLRLSREQIAVQSPDLSDDSKINRNNFRESFPKKFVRKTYALTSSISPFTNIKEDIFMKIFTFLQMVKQGQSQQVSFRPVKFLNSSKTFRERISQANESKMFSVLKSLEIETRKILNRIVRNTSAKDLDFEETLRKITKYKIVQKFQPISLIHSPNTIKKSERINKNFSSLKNSTQINGHIEIPSIVQTSKSTPLIIPSYSPFR